MTDAQELLRQAAASHHLGDTDAAIANCRAILAAQPRNAYALSMLGVIAQEKGNADLALRLIEAALGANPKLPDAWRNRGVVLRSLKRIDEAMDSVAHALKLNIAYGGAWSLQGMLLLDLGRFDDALKSLRHALTLEPRNAVFHADYAFALMTAHDLPAAYAAMRRALRLDPHANPLTLANILKQAGYPAKAIPYYRQAAAGFPHADIAVNEAMAQLQIGAFAEGWPLWERRRLPDLYPGIPDWDGKKTGRLLLYEDQGRGDALQGARYIPLVLERAEKVFLYAAPPLRTLFAASFPQVAIIEAAPPVDAKARLLSLPALFGTSLDNPPPPAPYLIAREEWREPWRARLAAMPSPRIGLVWAGNPANLTDHKRSIPFELLSPLLAAGAGHLVSLQLGVSPPPMFDAAPFLTDFAATSGLLAELDLLIVVDTAPAHLMGALGRPVWLLQSFDPHWPWLLGREDCLWYNAMRIFRQHAPRDWPPVIARAAEDLRRLIAGDASVLQPQPWRGPPLTQDPHAVALPEPEE